MVLQGGCLCGTVRYEIQGEPRDPTDYCHCRQCRCASGAPVVVWTQIPPDRFTLTSGQPRSYRSSAHALRWFCTRCGSQLYMTDPANHSVGVLVATLDRPEAVRPSAHSWASERITWFDLDDGLPRFPGASPYDN